MAQCVVCQEEFHRLNPLAKHARQFQCGACGGLVGQGCFEQGTNERGADTLTCLNCVQAGKRSDTPVGGLLAGPSRDLGQELALRMREEGGRLIEQADARGKAMLTEADARANKLLDRARQETDAAAERFVQHVESALERRAKEEVRTATLLFFIMAAAVAVTGALSLLFAWLHRAVL
ncbi:MAG: hypothetical protein HS116_03125 [Planctomycetes bacterium]|nr:hypothetical protein [Planctomycetota bacterium]